MAVDGIWSIRSPKGICSWCWTKTQSTIGALRTTKWFPIWERGGRSWACFRCPKDGKEGWIVKQRGMRLWWSMYAAVLLSHFSREAMRMWLRRVLVTNESKATLKLSYERSTNTVVEFNPIHITSHWFFSALICARCIFVATAKILCSSVIPTLLPNANSMQNSVSTSILGSIALFKSEEIP